MKKLNFSAMALLAAAMLSGGVAMAQTQTVTLTTAKAVGQDLTLTVNHTFDGVTVDWGDGTTQVYKNEAGNHEITGKVKGSTIKVVGPMGWDLIICSGQEITALDVRSAVELRSLYCQDNKLTELDLRGMKNLTDLNCANNQLQELTVSSQANLARDFQNIEYFNVAGNALTGNKGEFAMGTSTVPASSLQRVNISKNAFTKLYITYAPNIETLEAAHNQIAKAELSKNAKLASLVINDNEILCDNKNNKMGFRLAGGNALEQLVIDNNEIDSLYIGRVPKLRVLSAQNNGMHALIQPDSEKPMSLYDVRNNNLTFSALPLTNVKPENLQFAPQNALDLAEVPGVTTSSNEYFVLLCPDYGSKSDAQYVLNLSDYRRIGRTGSNLDGDPQSQTSFGVTWWAVDKDGNETELTKGTNINADYYYTTGKTTFFSPQTKVIGKMTTKKYTDIVIETKPFAVVATLPDAIGEIAAGEAGLSVKVQGGSIVLSAEAAQAASIATIDGKLVWRGTVNQQPVSVSLPKGVYIVAGKKVML